LPFLECIRDHAVDQDRIDTDPAVSHVDTLECPLEFPAGVVMVAELNRCFIGQATSHAAGIGTVSGDDTTIGEFDISEKALVTP
jgi:hypothetical protein